MSTTIIDISTITVRGRTLVCRRQTLTSKDDHRTVRVDIFLMAVDIGIQMNRKELTKTFMMIFR